MTYIEQVAKALNRTPQTIRYNLQEGLYPFGIAYKRKGSKTWSYDLYPEKVKEYIGIDLLASEDDGQ